MRADVFGGFRTHLPEIRLGGVGEVRVGGTEGLRPELDGDKRIRPTVGFVHGREPHPLDNVPTPSNSSECIQPCMMRAY